MSKLIKMNKTKSIDKKAFNEFENQVSRSQAFNIEWLMSNDKEALRLQIDNLTLTYGLEAVKTAVKETDIDLDKKSGKVA